MVFNEEYPNPIPNPIPRPKEPDSDVSLDELDKMLLDEVGKINFGEYLKPTHDKDQQFWIIGIGNNGAILCDALLFMNNIRHFEPEMMRNDLPAEIREEYKDIRYYKHKDSGFGSSLDFQLYDTYHSFLDNNPHVGFLKITELTTFSNCEWENITWKNDDSVNIVASFFNSLKETALEKEFQTKKLSGQEMFNLEIPIDMSRENISSNFFGSENKQLQSYVQKLSDQRIEYLRNILGFSWRQGNKKV